MTSTGHRLLSVALILCSLWLLPCPIARGLLSQRVAQVGWWPLGVSAFFAIQGTHLYATCGNSLIIVDITDPAMPIEKGVLYGAGYPQPGGPFEGRHVAVAGDIYCVTQDGIIFNEEGEGLVIVDVSDPNDPQFITRYDPPGLQIGPVAMQGNYVYLATKEGLKILDISTPSSPVPVGSVGGFLYPYMGGAVGGLKVAGDYVYYNTGYWVQIIDVTDKTNPTLAGRYDAEPLWLYDLAYKDGLLFAVGYHYVHIIDVSDPWLPSEVTTFGWPGGGYGNLALWNDYLAITAHDNGIFFYDVSTPAVPALVASKGYWGGYPRSPFVAGDYLYFALMYAGIEVDDISVLPDTPILHAVYHAADNYPPGINSVSFHGKTFSVAAEDGTACIVDDDGLIVLDVSTPSAPVYKSCLIWNSRGYHVTMKDDVAYCASTWGGFRIASVSDPDNPEMLDHVNPCESVDYVVVEGDYAYVRMDLYGCTLNGVRVYDVSDPSSIEFAGEYEIIPSSGRLGDFAIAGDDLYVAAAGDGLIILDVSEPGSITEEGRFQDAESDTHGVDVSGEYAYIADVGVGLRVINTSDPAKPSLVATTPNQEFLRCGYDSSCNVRSFGNYVYIASGSKGLRVVDVRDPWSPVEVAYYDREDTSQANGVWVDDDGLVYLAHFGGGLEILKLRGRRLEPTGVARDGQVIPKAAEGP